MRPSLRRADLHVDRRRAGRTRRAEHFVARHHEFHRTVRLARQRKRNRLHPHVRLAAEAAADFRRRDLQLRDVHAEQVAHCVAEREVALRGHPQFALAVGTDAREARVRFDVALVRLFGLVAALDDDVGLREAGLDVAVSELGFLRDVRRLRRLRFDAGGADVRLHDRRVRLHRLVDIGDVRQHFVVDLDQLQRLARRFGIDRGDRRNRVSVVQRAAARHAVLEHVEHAAVAFRQVRQIGAGDDRFDAFQLFGFRRIDLLDLRVRVRRAQHEPDELPGRERIGAVTRAPGDLIHAVGTRRPRADDLEFLIRECRIGVPLRFASDVSLCCNG